MMPGSLAVSFTPRKKISCLRTHKAFIIRSRVKAKVDQCIGGSQKPSRGDKKPSRGTQKLHRTAHERKRGGLRSHTSHGRHGRRWRNRSSHRHYAVPCRSARPPARDPFRRSGPRRRAYSSAARTGELTTSHCSLSFRGAVYVCVYWC